MKAYTVGNNPSGTVLKTASRNPFRQIISKRKANQVKIAPVVGLDANYLLGTSDDDCRDYPKCLLYAYPPSLVHQQEWIITPFKKSANQYFIKLSSNPNLVIESPETPDRGFTQVQGDVNENGGIQLWELVRTGSGWRLRNYKTGFYLYLDYFASAYGGHVQVFDDATTELPISYSYWLITPA